MTKEQIKYLNTKFVGVDVLIYDYKIKDYKLYKIKTIFIEPDSVDSMFPKFCISLFNQCLNKSYLMSYFYLSEVSNVIIKLSNPHRIINHKINYLNNLIEDKLTQRIK